jgi:predicted ester cyclase
MSERNKAIVRRIREEALSQGKLDLLDGLYADNYTYHGGAAFGEMTGRDVFSQLAAGYRQVFDGMTERVVDQVAEGNKVLSRLEGSGTLVGDLFGAKGAGQPMTWTAMTLVAFDAGGKITDEWAMADVADMLQQLGNWPG